MLLRVATVLAEPPAVILDKEKVDTKKMIVCFESESTLHCSSKLCTNEEAGPGMQHYNIEHLSKHCMFLSM